MALVPDNLAHCNYPIETPTQIKFWASSHKCNQAKAVIAFSHDEENAHRNMRRLLGWSYFFRKRALDSFGHFINTPSMSGIPFSEMESPYWECMPYGGGGTPPVETKPTVTIITSPKPVQVGDVIVITASVKGNPVPTISWKVSVNGKETTLPDTDDSISYTITEAGTLIFTCTATNKLGSDSDSITYTASEIPKPVITLQPKDVTVEEGETATFTTDGTGQDSIKWIYDHLDHVEEVSGETGKSYSFTTDIGDDGNKYAAQYINSGGITQSDWATLTVTPKPVLADIELIRPADGDKFRSGEVYKGSFKVNKPGFIAGHALPKYRTPDGTVYEASMPDTSVTPEGNNVYSYYFSDGYWALQNADVQFYIEALSGFTKERLNSNEATIQWSNSAPKPSIPPYITTQPKDATVDEGADATFSADADNSNSVKWQISTNGTDWNDISGATSKDYTFTTALSDDGNQYKAIFTNANGDSETSSATLTVNAVTPAGSINFDPTKPEDVVIDKLGPVQLVAETNPIGLDGEPTYKWLYSEDGNTWADGIGSSTGLSYYLSIAETPAKGETRYFKCIGNGTSSGVAIPQEETRVVSVTYKDSTQFSTDFRNKSFTDGTISRFDEFSYSVVKGGLDGVPFELVGSTSKLEREVPPGSGSWSTITAPNAWNDEIGYYPNTEINTNLGTAYKEFEVRMSVKEGGIGRMYYSPSKTYRIREAADIVEPRVTL